MNKTTETLLQLVSDLFGTPQGAYNIRENGQCAGRRSTEAVEITTKTDNPGIDIRVKPGVKGETVYIPACVTQSDFMDLVYNDFYIGDGAEITIIAGCGVHTDDDKNSQHNGIHRFFVGKNAHVKYVEKHIGTGDGTGKRIINPQTVAHLEENSVMEMDTTQIRGVDSTRRLTRADCKAGSRLLIREKLMTHGAQTAETDFEVQLTGEGSGTDLISRSVARGESQQVFRSKIIGMAPCTGHSECDAILMDSASVSAIPELTASHLEAALIHEAAIGKIAGEQLIKLMTLGLTEQEAEARIIDGFLK